LTRLQLRLLVADGEAAANRAETAAEQGRTFSDAYVDVLRGLARSAGFDIHIDVVYPADPVSAPAGASPLATCDGVVLTGSALHLWKADPESLRQVEFARAVFAAGAPFFGSCWGLQVAAVAAGGAVRPNPKGRELGFARNITLTEAGRRHPMYTGKMGAFSAPAVHLDEVSALPAGATITAFNGASDIQAAEIVCGSSVFWGVQYHPEYDLTDVARTLRSFGSRLVKDGFYRSKDAMTAHLDEIDALARDPSRTDVAWKLGLEQDILDPAIRLAEVSNWLAFCVRRRSNG
jgi:GMP synthase (glutamine-hydrolysing)